jgi:hypothetical protein
MTSTTAVRSIVAAVVLTVAVLVAFLSGWTGTYNAENTGVWFGGYGLELSGPDGIGVFHCGSDIGPFPGADC